MSKAIFFVLSVVLIFLSFITSMIDRDPKGVFAKWGTDITKSWGSPSQTQKAAMGMFWSGISIALLVVLFMVVGKSSEYRSDPEAQPLTTNGPLRVVQNP